MTNKNRIDYEVLGAGGLFNSFSNHLSSQRSAMHTSHKHSAQTPLVGEFPDCFSGFETHEADYLYFDFKVDEDIEIVNTIYKFSRFHIDNNPSAIVIFKRLSTGVIDYVKVRRYVNTTQAFGFTNSFDKINKLRPGSIIRAGSEIIYPTNKDPETGEYRPGWNANIAFMSDLETFEDAFPISQSFANKIASLSVETLTIDLDKDKHALNLYGDDFNYKVFPDIGECIREDGILAAIRRTSSLNILCDLNKYACKEVNPMHDNIIYGRPGAKVVDVEIFSNENLYGQLKEYADHQTKFYHDVYLTMKSVENEPFSPKLNTLFTEAIKHVQRDGVLSGRKKNIQITNKNIPIATRIQVTFIYQQQIEAGFKLTGRDGGKGVVHVVYPDEMMPIDDDGLRVDLIQDTASVIKRTIFSQLYEQFYNRTAKLVTERSKSMPPDKRFEYIIEFVRDVTKDYADMLIEAYPDKNEFLHEIDTTGLKLFFPPTANWVSLDHVLFIADKYKSEASYIHFPTKDEDGNIQYVRSKFPVMVGSKFEYLLYNMPDPLAFSVGPTSQYEVPTKSIKDRRFNLSRGATRVLGEDESRVLIHAVHPEAAERLRGLQAFSKTGSKELVKAILTADNPIDIEAQISNAEIKRSSAIKTVYSNLLQVIGVDISSSKISK